MPTEVKGALIGSVFRVLEAQHGKATADRIAQELPGEFGERWRAKSIIASAWCPIAWNVLLLHTIQSVFPNDAHFARGIGQACVVSDMQGIYRLFVKLLTPQMLISWGPRTFGQYYRGGTLEVVKSEEGHAVVAYSNWNGFDPLLWQAIMGGCCGGIEACGAKKIQAEFLSGGKDNEARIEYRWRIEKAG